MDLKSFSLANRERCEAPDGFNHSLDSWTLSEWMVAITGELGEAANVLKKLNRVRDGIRGNRENTPELWAKLARELADVYIYLDLMFQRLGLDMGTVVTDVFNAKSQEIGYQRKFIDHQQG
jgi:NTP pyrophosphatase (non-canonical NTP hydrolase)